MISKLQGEIWVGRRENSRNISIPRLLLQLPNNKSTHLQEITTSKNSRVVVKSRYLLEEGSILWLSNYFPSCKIVLHIGYKRGGSSKNEDCGPFPVSVECLQKRRRILGSRGSTLTSPFSRKIFLRMHFHAWNLDFTTTSSNRLEAQKKCQYLYIYAHIILTHFLFARYS